MSELDEFFYGEEAAKKKVAFETDLNRIEEENIEWFGERESNYPNEEHDRLHNHYMLHYGNGRVMIKIITDDLPDVIRDECLESFRNHFPD